MGIFGDFSGIARGRSLAAGKVKVWGNEDNAGDPWAWEMRGRQERVEPKGGRRPGFGLSFFCEKKVSVGLGCWVFFFGVV